MTATDPHPQPVRLNIWPGIWATMIAMAIALALSAWAWDKVPERIPVHFGLDGQPDRWGGKLEGLLIMPAVLGVLGLILAVIPKLDPRGNNLAQSAKFYYAVWYGEIAVMLVAHFGLVAAAFGHDQYTGTIIFAAVGVLFIVIGNYMSKSRANFFAGFRTPWTLSSDYAWQKTHSLAGPLFMLTGLATIAGALLLGPQWAVAIILVGIFTSILVGVIMSYVYWRKDPERRPGNTP